VENPEKPAHPDGNEIAITSRRKKIVWDFLRKSPLIIAGEANVILLIGRRSHALPRPRKFNRIIIVSKKTWTCISLLSGNGAV
jgi:hypothetical protein